MHFSLRIDDKKKAHNSWYTFLELCERFVVDVTNYYYLILKFDWNLYYNLQFKKIIIYFVNKIVPQTAHNF